MCATLFECGAQAACRRGEQYRHAAATRCPVLARAQSRALQPIRSLVDHKGLISQDYRVTTKGVQAVAPAAARGPRKCVAGMQRACQQYPRKLRPSPCLRSIPPAQSLALPQGVSAQR